MNSNHAPSCPKCFSPAKVANTLTDTDSYDLIRHRQCICCGYKFYTRQKREELLDLSLRVKWGQGSDMKNVQLIPKA